jgi:exopolysaccharide biosynthesis polyprenyl glycosylphosphotransferase
MLQRASFRYTLMLYIADMLVTAAALYLALLARRTWPLGKVFIEEYGGLSLPVLGITLLIWTAAFFAARVYDPKRIIRFEREVAQVGGAIAIATLVLAGTLYFSFRSVSRLLVAYFVIFDVVGLVGVRATMRLAWRNLGARRLPTSKILVVGAGVLGRDMVRALSEHAWMGLELAGYLDDDSAKQGRSSEGIPVLGTLGDAPRIVTEQGITDVLFALPLRAHSTMRNLVARLERLPVNIKVAPDLGPLAFYRTTMEAVGDIPVIGLKEPVIPPYQRFIKRAVDLILSSLALLVTLPVNAVIALVIKLDSPGPVIFSQERAGEGGKLFTMHKFRSMFVGAERMEAALVEDALHNGGKSFKGPDDPRATQVGRILRRTSLDELPQFWNVLKGDMSLVGPRPELPLLVDHYEAWQRKRFGVPQGMTGWWQVHDRSDKPMYLSTDDDLYYIQHYSLLLDFRIMLMTLLAIIRGKGAY